MQGARMDSPRRHSIAGRVHDVIPQASADLEAVISGPPLDEFAGHIAPVYANENQVRPGPRRCDRQNRLRSQSRLAVRRLYMCSLGTCSSTSKACVKQNCRVQQGHL